MEGIDDFLASYTEVYEKAKTFYKNNYPAMTDSVVEAKAHKLTEVRLGLANGPANQPLAQAPPGQFPGPPSVSSRHALPTATTIGTFFSNTARQQLLKLHKPLAEDKIPEPADLSLFWDGAEDVLLGMHPSIRVSSLD